MKNLMEQRICSSIVAGLNTAKILLAGRTLEVEEDDTEIELQLAKDESSAEERSVLERMIVRLEKISEDPKMQAVVHYLDKEKWREFGVIIFSQKGPTTVVFGKPMKGITIRASRVLKR